MFENERGESLEITLQALGQYVAGSSAVRCVILNACESLARLTFPIAEYTIGIEKRSAMTRRSNLLKDFTTRLLLVVFSSSLQRRELTRPDLRSSTPPSSF
jgi:hypothetical protein